ncbi:MAG TPA: aryl-sulfate sulfotransferase [Polyangiaceae bacterium]
MSVAIVASFAATLSFACSSSSNGVGPGAPDAAANDASGQDVAPGSDSGADVTFVPEAASDSAADSLAAPLLVQLSVSAGPDGAPGLALVPPFLPSIHDYYVRCAAGTNDLTVTLTASDGAEGALTQPIASPSSASQTLSVSVTENQAIVAVATESGATSDYWVRCLPHDFPKLTMTTHADAGAAPAGYYLVGNLMATTSAGYAMAIDGNGVPVWYEALPAGLGVLDVDNLVSGSISFVPYSATAIEDFEIHQLSPASTVTVAPTGYATDTHELRILPNGHYLVLSYPFTYGVDLTGLSIAPTVDGGATQTLGPNSTIQDCAVVEFDSSGTVVTAWLASDHFDPASDSTLPLTGFGAGSTLPDGGTVYDVFHCNAIDVDPANGNLLVSAREMDSIFYIEWSTGKVLWKMGGATASKDGASYVAVADPFFRQHDARLQPGWSSDCNGGSGQISLFDDESSKPGPARGVVYDVVVGGADAGAAGCDGGASLDAGAPGQATVAWQYKGILSSSATGSFRISADGSRVIGWGLGGAAGRAFTEVDVNGNDLLDFGFTDGNSTYRAIKVPTSVFDLSLLRSTAGTP